MQRIHKIISSQIAIHKNLDPRKFSAMWYFPNWFYNYVYNLSLDLQLKSLFLFGVCCEFLGWFVNSIIIPETWLSVNLIVQLFNFHTANWNGKFWDWEWGLGMRPGKESGYFHCCWVSCVSYSLWRVMWMRNCCFMSRESQLKNSCSLNLRQFVPPFNFFFYLLFPPSHPPSLPPPSLLPYLSSPSSPAPLSHHLSFTGSVKLKSLVIIGGEDEQHPRELRL